MPSFNDQRVNRIARLEEEIFDVVVIGGGISGAWIAYYAALNGLKTALLEQFDFASQTSSCSSKLLHSGVRYLQQLQFGKLRESALERSSYISAAPHIAENVAFLIPTYKDLARSKIFLNCGMLAHRILSVGESKRLTDKDLCIPATQTLATEQLEQIYPGIAGAPTGAVQFYERRMYDSERVVLSIIASAEKLGATALNYLPAQSLKREGNRITGVLAEDTIDKRPVEVNSRIVVNACGPWIDDLLGTQDQSIVDGFAVGSHLICRKIADHAIAITTKQRSGAKLDRGGRHAFIIPWRDHSMIGTSYDESKTAQPNLGITSSQITQLLDAIDEALPEVDLQREDIVAAYSGLLPLRTKRIDYSRYQASGEYQLFDHRQSDKLDGLISALGAKYTTGRKLGELCVRMVCKKLDRPFHAPSIRLADANYGNLKEFTQSRIKKYSHILDETTIYHLVRNYGSQLDTLVSSLEPTELAPICPHLPDIIGEIRWAVEHEQTYSLYDMIYHRSSLGLLGIDNDALIRVADLMASLLSWDEAQKQTQLASVHERMQSTEQAIAEAFDLRENGG